MDFYALFQRHVRKLTNPSAVGQVTGFCPFHDDQHQPSWSGNINEGTWHCFSCQAKGNGRNFAERVGERVEDQRQTYKPVSTYKPAPTVVLPVDSDKARIYWAQHEPVATYDYTDVAGTTLLYQVGKFLREGTRRKFFIPRTPDSTTPDGWRYTLDGTTRVLYRVAEIREAMEVMYCEGEKDVETLRRIGYAATTHAGGANGTLTPAMLACLGGKQVVMIPDNDDPGQQMADRVTGLLQRVAATVKRIILPGIQPGGDITDWIESGHTRDDLAALVGAAPVIGGCRPWVPAIVPFSEIEKETVPWLWHPVVPLGFLTLLQGDPGAGKGWFYLALAASLSIGQWPFFFNGGASSAAESDILVATNEDRPSSSIKARLEVMGGNQRRIHWFSGKRRQGDEQLSAITMADIPLMERAIRQTTSQLLVIDPMTGYLPEDVNPNRAEQVRRMLAPLDALAHRTQCAIVAVGHFNKNMGAPAMYRGSGSIDFAATARVVLHALELNGRTTKSTLHPTAKRFAIGQTKNNLSAKCSVLEFQVDYTGQFSWIGTLDTRIEDLITPQDKNDTTSPFMMQEARAFLVEMLKDGPCAVEKIKKHAKVAGVALQALTDARRDLGVGMQRDGGEWRWAIVNPGQYRNDH